MQQELKTNSYKEKALIPETTWLASKELPELNVTWKKQSNNVSINWNKQTEALSYVIYLKYGNNWQTEILSPEIINKNVASESNGKKLSTVVVRSVNRLGKFGGYKVVLVN